MRWWAEICFLHCSGELTTKGEIVRVWCCHHDCETPQKNLKSQIFGRILPSGFLCSESLNLLCSC